MAIEFTMTVVFHNADDPECPAAYQADPVAGVLHINMERFMQMDVHRRRKQVERAFWECRIESKRARLIAEENARKQ